MAAMEYYGGVAAVTVVDLTRNDDGEAVITRANYNQLVNRHRVKVLRPGKGLGSYALIEYSSLPERFRKRYEAKYGVPEKPSKGAAALRRDVAAEAFFAAYRLPDGSALQEEFQREYAVNASVLNALQAMVNTQKAYRGLCNNGTPVNWGGIVSASEELRSECGHTLPGSEARLRAKMREYARDGYSCLVSGKLGNTSALKVTDEAARYLVALRRSRTPVYSPAQILAKYNETAPSRGWKPLRSQTTLNAFLDRPEIRRQWVDAVYGSVAAKQELSRRNRTAMPTMRDSLWYGDGTKLNLFYRSDEGGRLTVRTAYVYEVSDAFNDTLLGYAIGATEDFGLQYRAFRMAVETAGHLPYEIVTDNQGGQTSRAAREFFQNICRVCRTTAPYNPQSKTIESCFGRFQRQVLAKDWRFTGGNISSKESWRINREFADANKESLYTFGELCEAYAAARREWNSMPDEARGMTRMEAYLASSNPETEAYLPQDAERLFWSSTASAVRFTTSGVTVTVGGRAHSYEVLTDAGEPDMEWRARNTGRSFVVRYDPLDLSQVRLYEETKSGLRFSATGKPYLTVQRNIQEQTAADVEVIRRNDEANKLMLVEASLEGKAAELENGTSPEQHGLVTPGVKWASESAYERLADSASAVPAAHPAEGSAESLDIGPYTKEMSGRDYDPLEALGRM